MRFDDSLAADDAAIDATIKPSPKRARVTNPTAQLDGQLSLLSDFLHNEGILLDSVTGTVQIHDMQFRETRVLKLFCNLQGILAVDSLLFVVALE
jgi:hypothetical protein